MGNVVDLKEWRNKRSQYKSASKMLTPDVLEKIATLLKKADDSRASVPHFGTVRLREQAVLDSLNYRERADKLAKEYGAVITFENNTYVITKV